MENLEKSLQFLGLKDEEIKIYLCCLEFGNLAVSSISRITTIGRVNCYHHIEKLVSKGYLSASQKGGTKIFSSENPQIFLNKEKERLNLVQDMMPSLLNLSSKTPNKPNITFFEGYDGIKNIFTKLEGINNQEIVSFSNFEKLAEFFSRDNFLKNHFKKRFTNNIKTRCISPRSELGDNFTNKFFPKNYNKALIEIFLIASNEFFFDSEITIFEGHIAILNLSKENPVGVLIENSELYKTQKTIFDLAWLGATSFISH